MRLEHPETGLHQPALGVVFGVVLVAGAGLAAAWLRVGLPLPVCHLRAWTGIPCPGCGSTRLVSALLAGDVAAAASQNPVVFGALAAIALWAVASAARLALGLPPRRLMLAPRERIALRVGAVLLVLASWLYQLFRG